MSEENKKVSNSLDMLKQMADVDLKIDKSLLDQESLRTPNLHNKWLRMLYDRKEKLKMFDCKKKILTRDKWLYYNGKASDDVYKEKGVFNYKVMKSDLQMFIDADEDFHKLEAQELRVKNEVEFIQNTLAEINRRSFNIANAIKFMMFTNGLNP